MGNNGIFFINQFDTVKDTSGKKYKNELISKLKEIDPSFDRTKCHVMYKNSNTAIHFSNLIKKPGDVKGEWTYERYKEYILDKEKSLNKVDAIYYGVFDEGVLSKIYKLNPDKILEEFKNKANKNKTGENGGKTFRKNITDKVLDNCKPDCIYPV